jgi:hypothetical protein
MDTAEYCREIETYLCRKNEGHLVRIVGPAFEQVCGWAVQGVPLKVVFRGIDQYCERYYRKGPRRRPIRIEFCEADILDLFDAWRRAIGVPSIDGESGEPATEPPPRKPALASHIERAVARLTTLRSGPHRPVVLDDVIDEAVRELEAMNARARQARGDARAGIIDDLARIDRRVLDASTGVIDASAAAALRRDAEAELAGFGSRLPPEVRARAAAAAFERLVRETLGVPVIAYE